MRKFLYYFSLLKIAERRNSYFFLIGSENWSKWCNKDHFYIGWPSTFCFLCLEKAALKKTDNTLQIVETQVPSWHLNITPPPSLLQLTTKPAATEIELNLPNNQAYPDSRVCQTQMWAHINIANPILNWLKNVLDYEENQFIMAVF